MSHRLTTDQKILIERLKGELNNLGISYEEGTVGIGEGVIPPFVLALLESIGYAKGLNLCAHGILFKHPAGWGKNLPLDAEEKIGSCNARGASGDIIWRKTGDRQ